MVRSGLKSFLAVEEAFHVVEAVGTLSEMLHVLRNEPIDVLLLDFKLGDGDGILGGIKALNLQPKLKILILTAFVEDAIVLSAKQANFAGVLFKSVQEDTLIETILNIATKQMTFEDCLPKEWACSLSFIPKHTFTPREITILDCLALGKTNIEIARELMLAEKTIRNYIHELFKKINVTNRTEAAAYWLKSSFLNRDK